jgi:hypothetical protein
MDEFVGEIPISFGLSRLGQRQEQGDQLQQEQTARPTR